MKYDEVNSQQKRAEILVVGNELLNGTTLDTNSHWLSKELSMHGIKLNRKTTVRDELSVISGVFKECISRKPDWLFSLGGLGPTYDDMTTEALGMALGKKLNMDETAVKMLKESYKRRARLFRRPVRRLTKASLKMAMIPEGSTPLQNPVGSAPGVLARFRSTNIVSLPGVPSEMKGIFEERIKPLLEGDSKFISAEQWVRVIGTSESRLSPSISRISKKYAPLLYIKSHPKGFERGRSIIDVQIIMTSTSVKQRDSLFSLERAAREMTAVAKRLGAKAIRRTQ